VLLMEKAGWPYLAATAGAIVLVSIVGTQITDWLTDRLRLTVGA